MGGLDIIIYTYTIEEAVKDGILLDLQSINEDWTHERSLITHVTFSLLHKEGYVNDEKVNIPNFLDLLNQSMQIIRKRSKEFTLEPKDSYYGLIETPNGEQREILMCKNEIEINAPHYTLMLPEDY